VVERVAHFLEGRTQDVLDDMEARMKAAATRLDFESAAVYRDQIQAVAKVTAQQRVFSLAEKDQDVVAFARDDGQACVQVFFIRAGRLIGREYFVLEGAGGEEDQAVLEAFLAQFYDEAAFVPPEILMPREVDQARIIESWLKSKRGDTVTLQVPREGEAHEVVEMATENAVETLAALRAQWAADQNRQTEALAELQEALELPAPPARIEGYDISTFYGTATYGSMVVFVHGVPRKSEYRRFKIRSVTGHSDDYASLQEVLRRRFRRAQVGREQPEACDDEGAPPKKIDASFAVMPDLILIDGGKGQLNAALDVLSECGLDHLPIFGLAKREEEVFVPGQGDPILLPRNSQGRFLIQRVRDEAHRFAITTHRRARNKLGLSSTLEAIPGVGPQRRKALLKAFGSMDKIRAATVDELTAVPGMTAKVARQVKEYL
jgi:excinuclease ABC subunit C